MRDLIIRLLKRVPILTGIRQGEGMDADQKTMMVDELVFVCKKFSYLSNEDKARILEDGMMKDPDFYGLNAKKAYKYLSDYWTALPSGTRYKLMGQEDDISDSEPLSPEDAQTYLEEWKRSLEAIGEPQKKTFVHRFRSKYEESAKIDQEVVDCPECENDPQDRVGCTGCNGFGQIKITKR